jgi:hypothetical protein
LPGRPGGVNVRNTAPGAPARSFQADEVLFDGQPLAIGEERDAAPGVRLLRLA